MTWEIVVGIIALVGFVVSIGTIVHNNTQAMTEVKCSIDALNSHLSTTDGNIDKLTGEVKDHEKRITTIEAKI